MKKSLAAAILFSALLPAAAQAQNAFDQLASPYEQEISIPAVPLPDRGDFVNTNFPAWDESSPLSYHQNRAELPFRAGTKAMIKNVRWGATPEDKKSYAWETVRIDASKLEKAVYGYKTAGTGHTFLVFVFGPEGAVNSKGESVRALTFGAEGWTREPMGYNIGHALGGKYPLIWNISTFESYADYVVSVKHSEMFFKRINIDAAQTAKLFAGVLARIDETNRGKELYNLFTNSCTNNPVSLLNSVLPEKQRISLEVAGIANPNAAIPIKAVNKYVAKGVLSGETVKVDGGNFKGLDLPGI